MDLQLVAAVLELVLSRATAHGIAALRTGTKPARSRYATGGEDESTRLHPDHSIDS